MTLIKLDCNQEYQLARLIAHGGMGSVYVAEQLGAAEFSKIVAIKMLRRNLATNSEFIRRFIAEAKLVADLVHENIVQVLTLNLSGGEYFIVMEYVDGITLEHFIAHHLGSCMPLPIDLGAFIISRVCRGLEYAHGRIGRDGQRLGLVHRDICPKNVLINREGVVKITDFGIARALSEAEPDQEILMGRMEYMSPEQARCEATDRRSDLYSLGVVMFELLTGRVPPRGAGSLQRLHQLELACARPASELRPELPDDLCSIMARALEPDPDSRYQSSREMGYELEYHLYGGGYGPTNQSLGEYLRSHFPQSACHPTDLPQDRKAMVVEQRADTAYGDLLERETE